ncbi:MAG: hypothetical protein ACXVAX_14010 [Pseudobdellovibrio sp.]
MILLLLFFFQTSVQADEFRIAHLCAQGEKVYFNCQTAKDSKTISVCGSPDLSKKRGYLKYRFGTPEKIELEFPSNKKNSLQKFYFAHYLRYQTDYSLLSFTHKKFKYAVFKNYDETQKPKTSSGVMITTDDQNEKSIICKNELVFELNQLEGIVACDPEDALTMGQCKK